VFRGKKSQVSNCAALGCRVFCKCAAEVARMPIYSRRFKHHYLIRPHIHTYIASDSRLPEQWNIRPSQLGARLGLWFHHERHAPDEGYSEFPDYFTLQAERDTDLIAELSPILLNSLKELLRAENLSVHPLPSPDALADVEAHAPFDLLLFDQDVPEIMSGEFLSALKRRWQICLTSLYQTAIPQKNERVA
jgi:hypothetical protein